MPATIEATLTQGACLLSWSHPATGASGPLAGSDLRALLTTDSAARKPGRLEWEEGLFWFQLSRENLQAERTEEEGAALCLPSSLL